MTTTRWILLAVALFAAGAWLLDRPEPDAAPPTPVAVAPASPLCPGVGIDGKCPMTDIGPPTSFCATSGNASTCYSTTTSDSFIHLSTSPTAIVPTCRDDEIVVSTTSSEAPYGSNLRCWPASRTGSR